MNNLLRETAAQDHLEALYAQAKAARRAAECCAPGPRRLHRHVWSLWLGRWGLSVVLHHQG
ncbi:hypothetical protein [Deinococcus sp.]|uniref:hypothetical protein n=1 Tax=Deinococcus sp. TaxID=47478 RepID=UPI0025FA9987|nr:hypothetical protein [Deinococcus sp.]